MVDDPVSRCTLTIGGQQLSYLRAGEGSPLLLLHGTYWSHVRAPVTPRLAELILHAADALQVGDSPGGASRGPRASFVAG